MIRRLTLTFGLAACVLIAALSGSHASEELLAVVYETSADGSKGRRVHRQTLLPAATEEHSAAITLCGEQFFGYESDLQELSAFAPETHLIILYRTTVDPVTKNSRREELCRSGS